jgi:hypothetical protein
MEPSQEEVSQGLDMLLKDSDIWRARILITAAELDVFTAVERGAGTSSTMTATRIFVLSRAFSSPTRRTTSAPGCVCRRWIGKRGAV